MKGLFLEPELKFDLTFILGGVQPIFVMLTEMERKYLWSKAEFLFPTCPLSFFPLLPHIVTSLSTLKLIFVLNNICPQKFSHFKANMRKTVYQDKGILKEPPLTLPSPLPPLHYSSQNAPPNPLPSHQLLNLHKIDFKFPFQPQKLDWQNYC